MPCMQSVPTSCPLSHSLLLSPRTTEGEIIIFYVVNPSISRSLHSVTEYFNNQLVKYRGVMASSYPGRRNRNSNPPRNANIAARLFASPRSSSTSQPQSSSSSSSVPVGPDFDRQVEALIPAEVRMISGCHSLETSADISNVQSVAQGQLPSPAGKSGGACTSALLSILYDPRYKGISFQQLLLELRQRLSSAGMSQIPQLSGSRPLDLAETPFSLVNQQPLFRNNVHGTHRALLVGINYYGQQGQLSGCINDVQNVRQYLLEHQGFLPENITILADDGRCPSPTRQKIIHGLRQLVTQSSPGDSVYFHYSGHGGLLDPDYWNRFKQAYNDRTFDKEYDETLYPVDHGLAGQIRDFSLFNHFVKPMPAGVTVTCVMDCCHSGSVLDLPYTYQPTSAGTIRMRQSMNALTNLAFLYILAGGILPMEGGLFDSVTQHLQDVLGESIDSLTGTGVEEMAFDTAAFQENTFGMDSLALDGGDFGVDGNEMFDSQVREYDQADDGDYGGTFGAAFRSQGDGADVGSENPGGLDCAAGGDDDDVNCGDCDVADILGNILEEL
jgi:metacaspase-1